MVEYFQSSVVKPSKCGDGFLRLNSISYSSRYGGCFYPTFFSPFRNRKSNPFNFYDCVSTSVVRLIGVVRPPAILWRVAKQIVNPFNAKTARRNSHVFKEVLKRVFPSVANSYSSSAVTGEIKTFGIAASCFYVRPNAILSRLSLAVCCVEKSACFNRQTAARFAFSSPQIAAEKNPALTTLANAIPSSAIFMCGRGTDNGEPTAFHSHHINRIMSGLDRVASGCYDFCRFIHSFFMFGFSGSRSAKSDFPRQLSSQLHSFAT